jgi:hypothetical protein
MVTYKDRSESINPTETAQLHVTFRSFSTGLPTDLDSFPTISIIQPSGNVLVSQTSAGVYHLATGIYGYDLPISINAPWGVWTDLWRGSVDGYQSVQERNFIVQNTQFQSSVPGDGYLSLGIDIGFDFSQVAIQNINKLLKTLRARLNSSGKKKGVDQFGNEFYSDCDIFSTDTLVTLLCNSLTMFNQIPHFTLFSMDDTTIIDQFHEVIVQGAVIYALAGKALIERGREYNLSDSGISFTPPTVSELLNTEWSTELSNFTEKVKFIKNSLKPSALGLGTLTISTSRNPAIARLRHLRARQIF